VTAGVTVVQRRLGSYPEALVTKGSVPMGDKSPKAKDKAKKQGTADKDQKKAVAADKVAKQSANTPKKK
jgi:hypothetical protein